VFTCSFDWWLKRLQCLWLHYLIKCVVSTEMFNCLHSLLLMCFRYCLCISSRIVHLFLCCIFLESGETRRSGTGEVEREGQSGSSSSVPFMCVYSRLCAFSLCRGSNTYARSRAPLYVPVRLAAQNEMLVTTDRRLFCPTKTRNLFLMLDGLRHSEKSCTKTYVHEHMYVCDH